MAATTTRRSLLVPAAATMTFLAVLAVSLIATVASAQGCTAVGCLMCVEDDANRCSVCDTDYNWTLNTQTNTCYGGVEHGDSVAGTLSAGLMALVAAVALLSAISP